MELQFGDIQVDRRTWKGEFFRPVQTTVIAEIKRTRSGGDESSMAKSERDRGDNRGDYTGTDSSSTISWWVGGVKMKVTTSKPQTESDRDESVARNELGNTIKNSRREALSGRGNSIASSRAPSGGAMESVDVDNVE